MKETRVLYHFSNQLTRLAKRERERIMLKNAASYMSLGASGIIPVSRRIVIKIVKEAVLMKKTLLLILLSAIFLFGCGGPSSETGGTTPGGGGGGTPPPASVNNVTVNFPPAPVQNGLIDGEADVRNAGRLVATHEAVVGQECSQYQDQEVCLDPPDNTDCYIDSVCVAYIDVIGLKVEAVADAPLTAAGGSVSMAVPPDSVNPYTILALTYTHGEFDGALDTFTPGAITLSNNRVVMDVNGLNLIRDYGETAPFTLDPGETVTVTINWETNPLAQIVLPTDPILSGDSYVASIGSKSAALRDTWYVHQLLDEADMTGTWFVSESGDVYGTSSGTTMNLRTDVLTGTPPVGSPNYPAFTIWNFAQFFISSDMLWKGENWRSWTYGTSDAGASNPWGQVIVNP